MNKVLEKIISFSKNKFWLFQIGNTSIIFAAANGHTEIVKLLLDAGADVNMKNNVRKILDIVVYWDSPNREIVHLFWQPWKATMTS
jgi:ankyrin repeat protein